MCSILGFCGSDGDEEEIKKALAKTHSRGPDATRLIDTGRGFLGFNRLSIMGLTDSGMQPFIKEDVMLACNGEIYGFRKLKDELTEKGYSFESDSDCSPLEIPKPP